MIDVNKLTIMKNTLRETERYLDKHWFDYYNTDALMAKYWAAKEMAEYLVDYTLGTDSMPRVNREWWNAKYKIMDFDILVSNLTQILKKEWFR